jgi:hypothetical protein
MLFLCLFIQQYSSSHSIILVRIPDQTQLPLKYGPVLHVQAFELHIKYMIQSSLWKPYGSYQVNYAIISVYLSYVLKHAVSLLVSRVLHSQIFMIPVLGVGCAMVTVSLIVCIYYNVIMSYTVFYMVSSFASEVPWSKCDPSWADMSTCYVRGSRAVSNTQLMLDLSAEFFIR